MRAGLAPARRRDPRSAEAYPAQGFLADIATTAVDGMPRSWRWREAAAKGLECTLGPYHPDTLARSAQLRSVPGRWQASEAIAVLERIRDAQVAKLGPYPPDTLVMLNHLASAYRAAGKLPEAIALFERVRDARIAKLGPDHPDNLATLNNLAFGALRTLGKLPEAIALLERVRDARIAKLGPDHPDTLITLNNLAGAYLDAGRLPEAIALFERVRDAQIASSAATTPTPWARSTTSPRRTGEQSNSTNPCLCSRSAQAA